MTRLSMNGMARLGGAVGLATMLAVPYALPVAADGSAAVSMTEPSSEHYAFTPAGITVPVGTTVTWTDQTDAPHTVTSDSGAFASSILNQNQAFHFTFNQAGTFAYHCAVHPYMHGSIIVTAAAKTTAPVAAAPAAPAPSTAAATAPTAAAAPAQIPASMPSTGAGGTSLPRSGAAIVALLALLGGLITAARRKATR